MFGVRGSGFEVRGSRFRLRLALWLWLRDFSRSVRPEDKDTTFCGTFVRYTRTFNFRHGHIEQRTFLNTSSITARICANARHYHILRYICQALPHEHSASGVHNKPVLSALPDFRLWFGCILDPLPQGLQLLLVIVRSHKKNMNIHTGRAGE